MRARVFFGGGVCVCVGEAPFVYLGWAGQAVGRGAAAVWGG